MKYLKLIKEKINQFNNTIFGLILCYLVPLVTPYASFVLLEYLWRTQKDGTLASNPFDAMQKTIIGFNVVLIYLLAAILLFLISNSRISSIIIIVASYVVGLANYFVVMFRSSPIVPSDIYSVGIAAEVSNNFEFVISRMIVLLSLAAIAGIIINIIFGFKLPSYKKNILSWLIHIVPAAVCIIGITLLGNYISTDNVKEKIEGFNDTLFIPNIMYTEDGYSLATLYSFELMNVKKPSGYSSEKASNLLSTYYDDYVWNYNPLSKIGDDTTMITTSTSNADIVVIMNEAFSDPNVLGRFSTNQDYMPYTHSLMHGAEPNVISGYLYASVLGGNTANTEFEFLTGNTMAFLPAGSVPYQQYINNNVGSMASLLSSQNYNTVAAHPYISTGWKRNMIYPLFGFNQSFFSMHMSDLNDVRIYCDDQSFYNWLENNVFNNQAKYFSFNVTMQNHGAYGGDFDNFKASIFANEFDNLYFNNYISLIKMSDDALLNLINYFKSGPRPTIVVMFGDHQPNDMTVADIYRVNNKDITNLTDKENFDRYKVPLIIWANYDIPEVGNLQISANYLGGLVTKLAGCKTSAYQNFLENLRAEIPVITSRGFLDSNGEYHKIKDIDKYSSFIDDYRTLQYYSLFK